MNHNYDKYLIGDVFPYTYVDLIDSDGSRTHYSRISPGTDFSNAVYQTTTVSALYSTQIAWNGTGWNLTLKDGTVMVFLDGYGATLPTQGGLSSITDRYGNKTTMTRDATTGNLLKVTSPNGRYIAFSFDSNNRVNHATDNSGRSYAYAYDAGGRLATVTDPMNGVTQYTYDANNQMLTLVDPRGNTYLTNQYDSNGRMTMQTMVDGGIWQFAYTQDGNGNIVQTDMTNPRGFVERLTFNTNGYFSGGQIIRDTKALTQPEQQIYTYSRDPSSGFLLSLTDSINRTTSYSYDTKGNRLSVTEMSGTASAAVTSSTYDPTYNLITSFTDPLLHTTSYQYVGPGNLASTNDPLGNGTSFSYNPAGQPLSAGFASGTVHYGYQSGDLIQITSPAGYVSSRTLDSIGTQVTVTDGVGQLTRSSSDALGRPVQLIDALGDTFSLAYDGNNNALAITDPRNSRFLYSYDSMDRISTRTDPLSPAGVAVYQYDTTGNLTMLTDRNGASTNMTYDSLNRISQVTLADSATIVYSYDAANRLTQIVDSLYGTLTRSYDDFDRLLSETSPLGTVSYTYDATGRRMTMSAPGQAITFYSYDNASRLTQISQGAQTAGFSYDAAGRRTALALPGTFSVSYSYDTDSNLSELDYYQGTALLGTLTYRYDAERRIVSRGGTMATTLLPSSLTSSSYNSDDQLTQSGPSVITYDANGNMTSDGTNTYTWNARKQLAAISGPGIAASFSYDPFGRRVSRTLNGAATTFMYDGDEILQEISGGAISAQMLRSLSTDEVLLRTDSSGSQVVLSDSVGSTVALGDTSAGTVTTRYSYEPFGNVSTSGPPSSNPYKFTGREDDGTGLYYYRARYYSPRFQRFLSEDPLDFRGGGNLYAYVTNDPINSTDPSGLLVYICARKAFPYPHTNWLNKGNHTYFWDDRGKTDNCARGDGNNPHGSEGGPGSPGVGCVAIPGSQNPGVADDLMKCCRDQTAAARPAHPDLGGDRGGNKGGEGTTPWFPGQHDCHTLLDVCIAKLGLTNPGSPGGYWGKPCPKCKAPK